MCDKLIHDYMGINYLIVWDVAKNIILTLIPQIEEIIAVGEDEVKELLFDYGKNHTRPTSH